MQLADALLFANNSQDIFAHAEVYAEPDKGVVIHKIDFIAAWHQATILEPALAAVKIPLTFGMSCFMVEGLGDPNCINQNIGFNPDGSPRSNESKNDPDDVDTGACQLKVGYLHPHPAPTLERAQAFALTPETAIPYFASIMSEKLAWAKELVAKTPSPLALYADYRMVATGAYNEGEDGFIKDFYTPGLALHHCSSVQDWERFYAEKLGVPSLYPVRGR
jgi:hypothetical protein